MAALAPLAAAQVFARFPDAVLRRIWIALPVTTRAYCACVCRAWRISLEDPVLWARLSLLMSDVFCGALFEGTGGDLNSRTQVFDARLRGAAAKAGAGLAFIEITAGASPYTRFQTLLEVATANAGSLRELRVSPCGLNAENIFALLGAAPHLTAFDLFASDYYGGLSCEVIVAQRMLLNEGVYRPLRLGALRVTGVQLVTTAELHALASAVAGHTSLRCLELTALPFENAALDAMLDAALTCKVLVLRLVQCNLSSASAPALARLLNEGSLEQLWLSGGGYALPCFDILAAALIAPALRANRSLKTLSFSGLGLWRNDSVAMAILLAGLAGHPILQQLLLFGDTREAVMDSAAAAVAAAVIAVLLAADAPSLTTLTWI